jgi:hypothetical protein
MGLLAGYRQVCLYFKPDVFERANHAARILNEPLYAYVNAAVEKSLVERLTPEQLRALNVLVKPVVDTPRASSTVKKPKRLSQKKR